MSHRRRPLAVLAIVVSLLLAGAPVTNALPEHEATSRANSVLLLDWLGAWGGVLARVFNANEAPPASEPDLADPLPTAGPEQTLQSSPMGEAGPDVDPDG
jgi:hypothetical protein